MAWATPLYSQAQVNAAARKLSVQQFPLRADNALYIINNWRAAHSYPLNTFQITLRNKAKKIERDIIVAQRTKRLESIHAKLVRLPSMRMIQMQDIAGCRVVFKNMSSVNRLIQDYQESTFDHILVGQKDYVDCPKRDGYRCKHLVYEYVGNQNTLAYSGLKVEIQFRTQLQHTWATAVEAVGIFTKQALKSNQGDEDWLRFFALMGSVVAAIEKSNPVPGTPTDKDLLVAEITALAAKLRVLPSLSVYNTTLEFIGSKKDAKYFLIRMEPDKMKIRASRFKASESKSANDEYTMAESSLPSDSSMQIVLVSVDSISALRRAYPNYFLDTNLFAGLVRKALAGDFPSPLRQKTTSLAA